MSRLLNLVNFKTALQLLRYGFLVPLAEGEGGKKENFPQAGISTDLGSAIDSLD